MNLTDAYPWGKRALTAVRWACNRLIDLEDYLDRWVHTIERDGWPA